MLNGQPIVESFSFGRKDYTLNEPKPSDYYMDNKFWKNEEENLDKSSFVVNAPVLSINNALFMSCFCI